WVVAKPIDAEELTDALGAAVLAGRVRVLAIGRDAVRPRAGRALESLGIESMWASDASEAARLCARARFEVALVDAGLDSAADLRETFKEERARSAQLRASYITTVRALANAVEARDAYTGKHAERVAAYGLALARAMGSRLADDPEIEFGFLLHDIGKVAVP